MPRKRRRTQLSIYGVPTIDYSKDRNAVEDHDLVQHVLVDFDELAGLSAKIHKQLVDDLVVAIYYARGGIRAGKRHVSDKALGKHICLSDIGRALEKAGLPVKRWRKHDHGGGESLYYRIAHALSDVFGLSLPKDLKPLARRAAQHQYGVMSRTMKAAQDAELRATGRRRLGRVRK